MLEKNKIYLMDCIEGLKKLDDNSVDLFLFSPPYNKKGFLGKKAHKYVEGGLWNDTINYGNGVLRKGKTYDDDMAEDDYKQWQIEILNLCAQKLKKNGSIFYQHKTRPKDDEISIPYEWICKSNTKIRQLIIWDRGGSTNISTNRFLPTTEQIWWLTPKDNKNTRFYRQNAMTEVWRIPADTRNDHPAPYPVALAKNVIKNVLGTKEMIAKMGNLLVVDLFMGSGTTAVAAKKLGCDYIGFDIYQPYIDMANERIASTECVVEKNNTIWD